LPQARSEVGEEACGKFVPPTAVLAFWAILAAFRICKLQKTRGNRGSTPAAWEQAEHLRPPVRSLCRRRGATWKLHVLPTVKHAVTAILADARAAVGRRHRPEVSTIFENNCCLLRRGADPLPAEREHQGPDQVAPHLEGRPARPQEKHERVVGFFWFCVRQVGPAKPTQAMGRSSPSTPPPITSDSPSTPPSSTPVGG